MEEQLYLLAIGLSLEEKVEKAIANLRHYEHEALKRDPRGYYLCDSFGKDSCVILHLAKMAGVKFTAHHALTTLDAPELIQFGKKHHPETEIQRPEMSMLTMMAQQKGQGPPTRMSRWCCEAYKETKGAGSVKVFGVRAAESPRRKAKWRIWTPWKARRADQEDTWVLNPILFWSDDDVWLYLKRNNVPYCSLYDEGWSRLGCIGCPMADTKRDAEFQRWPKYKQAWQRAFSKWWDKWHGVPLLKERWVSKEGKYPLRPIPGERLERRYVKDRDREEDGFWTFRRWYDLREFTCWEDMWKWWLEELPIPEKDDCQMGLF